MAVSPSVVSMPKACAGLVRAGTEWHPCASSTACAISERAGSRAPCAVKPRAHDARRHRFAHRPDSWRRASGAASRDTRQAAPPVRRSAPVLRLAALRSRSSAMPRPGQAVRRGSMLSRARPAMASAAGTGGRAPHGPQPVSTPARLRARGRRGHTWLPGRPRPARWRRPAVSSRTASRRSVRQAVRRLVRLPAP
jgi:hypothetical protein